MQMSLHLLIYTVAGWIFDEMMCFIGNEGKHPGRNPDD